MEISCLKSKLAYFIIGVLKALFEYLKLDTKHLD